jgi:DNA-directed RNA polymerase subunit RPC12/RpoP
VTFHYFQCGHCKTWAVTLKDYRYVKCNGCGGSKASKYKAHGDSQDIIDYCTKNGIAHLPLPGPNRKLPCVRCGQDALNATMLRRTDGLVCRPCYRAEERPPVKKITEADIAAAHVAHLERERQIRQFEREQDALNQGVSTSSTGE